MINPENYISSSHISRISWNKVVVCSVVWLLFCSVIAKNLASKKVEINPLSGTLSGTFTSPCNTLGTLNLCFEKKELAPGVFHYKWRGLYGALQDQGIELVVVDAASPAQIQVQNSQKGREALIELASKVSGSIAAINGGYFHYAKGLYEWDGPYKVGDLVGGLVVDGKMISENRGDAHWGCLRIDQNKSIAIHETLTSFSDPMNTNFPQYSIEAAPLLVRNGVPISFEDLPPPRKVRGIISPGIDYPNHSRLKASRSGVCLTKEKSTVLGIIEGRRGSDSKGFTIQDFAQFFKSLGCEQALNLDGGGSADLVSRSVDDNELRSTVSPYDFGQRSIASAVLITYNKS